MGYMAIKMPCLLPLWILIVSSLQHAFNNHQALLLIRGEQTHIRYTIQRREQKIHITQEILYFGPLMALSLEKIVYISGKKKEKLCKADFTIQYLPMTLDECQ